MTYIDTMAELGKQIPADHADWAPSSMYRIMNCPNSVELVKLYEKEENAAANLGVVAHGVLEDCITFGTAPAHHDEELNEGVQLAVDYVEKRLNELGKDTEVYIEKRLAIPDTPVWGTADLVFVNPRVIEIADYKHGYLPVTVERNLQLFAYLTAAIAEFGTRKSYRITVMQPRYFHIDGPIRSDDPTAEDVEFFMSELVSALRNWDKIYAGKHCKYCPASGACAVLAGYLMPFLGKALDYDLTDKHTFDNVTMAKLLDFTDLLPGWINEVRTEAYRRIMQDREVHGWKIVQGQQTREFVEGAEPKLKELYEEFGIPPDALYEASLASPRTVEYQVKAAFKPHGRKAWVEPFKRIEEVIKTKSSAPSLVRAIDGRPVLRRGDEFTELPVQDGEILI